MRAKSRRSAGRLSDPRYVETFLKLNCLLLLNRECTTLEKGDVLAYLMTFEGGGKGDLINVGSRSAHHGRCTGLNYST